VRSWHFEDMDKQENEPLLVQHLSKSFHGVRRVEEIAFTVGTGRATGPLGPKGAGKTPTIR
jgi:ABC-type branched-subunit amino acid transport system ATPase component